jgi:hypothetical protein
MNGQTDRQADGQTDGRMDRQTHGQADGRTDRRTGRQTDRQKNIEINRHHTGKKSVGNPYNNILEIRFLLRSRK